MDAIGRRPAAVTALQKKVLTSVEQVKTAVKSTVLQQSQTGFQNTTPTPVTLNAQGAVVTSNATPMSIRDTIRAQQAVTIGPQTRATMEAMTRGLPAADKALVEAKVAELVADNRGIETTNPQRFAANMALELSENIGAGDRISPQLMELFKATVIQGKEIFQNNPMALQALQHNIAQRDANVAAQNSPLARLPDIDRTRAAVAALTANLPPQEKAMVEAKVVELVKDGRSIEKTNPQRFAANLALELSEHFGAGGQVTDALRVLFRTAVQQGETVFKANPQARQALDNNMMARLKNLQPGATP